VGTSATGEDPDLYGVAAVVVAVAAQDECTSVAAGQPLGGIYSRAVDRTHTVRSDSSNPGFAASYCCTGRSAICCGCCLVAQCRKRDNRPQIVMVVGFRCSIEGESRPYSWEGIRSWTSRSSQAKMGWRLLGVHGLRF
jgi:hypothetical protein